MEKVFIRSEQLKKSTISTLIMEIVLLFIIGIVSAFIWVVALFEIFVVVSLIMSIINIVSVNKIKLVVTNEGIYGERAILLGTKKFNYSYSQLENVINRNNYAITIQAKGEEPWHLAIGNVEEAVALICEKINK